MGVRVRALLRKAGIRPPFVCRARLWAIATSTQAFRQGGKAFGCRFGDVAVGDFWLEAFWGGPDAAQQSQLVGLVKLFDADRVGLAPVATTCSQALFFASSY